MFNFSSYNFIFYFFNELNIIIIYKCLDNYNIYRKLVNCFVILKTFH